MNLGAAASSHKLPHKVSVHFPPILRDWIYFSFCAGMKKYKFNCIIHFFQLKNQVKMVQLPNRNFARLTTHGLSWKFIHDHGNFNRLFVTTFPSIENHPWESMFLKYRDRKNYDDVVMGESRMIMVNSKVVIWSLVFSVLEFHQNSISKTILAGRVRFRRRHLGQFRQHGL